MTNDTDITIITETISLAQVQSLAEKWHNTMVKGVVDVEKEIIALGGQWHMDANTVLIENGSTQEHIWGFNIYPDESGEHAIEYISLINIRPAQNNRSMEVEDSRLRDTMKEIVKARIPELNI